MTWSPLNHDHTLDEGITPVPLMVRDAAFRWRVVGIIFYMPDLYAARIKLVMCLEKEVTRAKR